MAFFNTLALAKVSDFDMSRVVFDKPSVNSVPNSSLTYKRINIGYRVGDTEVSELIIPTGRLFSYGVSENTSLDTGKVNGYSMGLCLWERNTTPTPQQAAFLEVFEGIVEKVKDHVLSIKDNLGKYDLERPELKKLNPLYYKRENGKPVEGSPPTLYAKLIHSKKNDKILTIMYGPKPSRTPINPLDLINKMCHVDAAVKIESVFVGTKIALQVKLYEAEVSLQSSGMRSLLCDDVCGDTNLVADPVNDQDYDEAMDCVL